MIQINKGLKPSDLATKLERFWTLSGEKINLIEKNYDTSKGSPVFTMAGNTPPVGGLNGLRVFNMGRPFYNMM